MPFRARREAPLVLLALALTRLSTAQTQKPRLQPELSEPWKSWLQQDVLYIISKEEKEAFQSLKTDDQRQHFIQQFWQRRDPTPDTQENEYKEEHYRRIAYANDHFASKLPGWKSDRGMVYIKYGAPDEIESHAAGDGAEVPRQQWRYRYIADVGINVMVDFVDARMTGEYLIAVEPAESEILTYVDLQQKADGLRPSQKDKPQPSPEQEFERLEAYSMPLKSPAIEFKDLNALAASHINYNTLPVSLQVTYAHLTKATSYANLALQFKTTAGNIRVFGQVHPQLPEASTGSKTHSRTSPARTPGNSFLLSAHTV